MNHQHFTGGLITVIFLCHTEPPLPPSKPVPDIERLRNETEELSVKVRNFYFGKTVPVKGPQQKEKSTPGDLVEDVKEV